MIERRPVALEPPHEFFAAALVDDLYADRFHAGRVDGVVGLVLGPELHHPSGVEQPLHEPEQRQRPGVPIRHQRVMVDHQDHGAVLRPVPRAQELGAPWVVIPLQHAEPARGHPRHVDGLERLDALVLIGPVRHPLVMDDDGAGHVEHLLAGGAQAEGEVAVLAIGRQENLVEAVHLLEGIAADHERGARAVIGLADVVVFGAGRVEAATVVPGVAVIPQNAAGFLQRAVREDQLRARHCGIRPDVERVGQGIDGAGPEFGVVVEEI